LRKTQTPILYIIMAAASSSTQPAAQLTIEELLEVPLLCFEAAADTLPQLLAYAKPLPKRASPNGVPSYVVWRNNDLKTNPPSPAELASTGFPPESLPAAVARMNLCDTFAMLLEKEVSWLMKDVGGRAEWLVLQPRPDFALYTCWEGTPFVPRSHSVLQITLKDGTKMIMDGTLEQFGWPRSTWLLSFADFRLERMGGWSEPVRETARRMIQRSFKTKDHGLWAEMQARMEELFGELNWDKIKSLPRGERVKTVKEQAEAKFAGVWEKTGMVAGWFNVQ
jgi:hypothetical protein